VNFTAEGRPGGPASFFMVSAGTLCVPDGPVPSVEKTRICAFGAAPAVSSAGEGSAVMTFQNNDSINQLINEAGKRAGVDPGSLKRTIDSGKLDDLLAKMDQKDADKFRKIVQSPELARQLLKTPQAQKLIQQFMQQGGN